MKRTVLLWAAAGLLLAACAAKAPPLTYESMAKSWIGHNIKEVMEVWGVPTSTAVLPDDTKAFQYDEMSTPKVKMGYYFFQKPKNEDWQCKTIFFTDSQGQIRRMKFEGGGCTPNEKRVAPAVPGDQTQPTMIAPSV